MPKKWTREERKRHLKGKYFSLRQKIFMFLVALIIFIILLYALYLAVKTSNIDLLVVLIIAIIIFVPIAIFAIDLFHWEAE